MRNLSIKQVVGLNVAIICFAIVGSNSSQASLFSVGEPSEISFSPDNSKVGFIWCDDQSAPFVVDSPVSKRKMFACWCDVKHPGSVKSVEVYSTTGQLYGPSVADLKFSPDSRHLAAFTRDGLFVVNLKSKKRLQISGPGEKVTSFQWLGKDEIGYCVHTYGKKQPQISGPGKKVTRFQWLGKDEIGYLRAYGKKTGSDYKKLFWRQKIDQGPQARSQIYSEPSVPSIYQFRLWPLEYWSPKGRYALFLRNFGEADNEFRLLDVAAGTIKLKFGQPSRPNTFGYEGDTGISWKLDGSAVFCTAGTKGKSRNQAFLVDTETGRILDCSSDFNKEFSRDPILLPFWTPDGKYVIKRLDGRLIQPHPWKVINPAVPLAKQFGYGDDHMQMFALNIPNWVGLGWAGNGQTSMVRFAVDYKSQKFVKLFKDPGFFACSSDGKNAAVIYRSKKVKLRKLDVTNFKTFTSNAP